MHIYSWYNNRSICDRICEKVPNFGFNNYTLVAILSAYIILSISSFFGSYELLPLLSRLGKYGRPTPFHSLLTAVRKHVPRTHNR